MNLRHLVEEVITSSDSASPKHIAAEVLARIPARQSREALEQALPSLVQSVVSSRRSPLGQVPSVSPIPGQGVAFHQRGVTVRDGWQRALGDRYKDPESGWMFLRDASAENLERMAQYLDGLAEAHQTKARRLRVLKSALAEHGAELVGDLPAETLMPLLGAKAA